MMEKSPKSLSYYFPAEWYPHRATWLSWPHNAASWPDRLETIYPVYSQFVREISLGERVCINVNDALSQKKAEEHLLRAGVDLSQIDFFLHPTNDAWCRDHGPAFVISKEDPAKKALVKWQYNAWGGKYPPYDLDNQIPLKIAAELGLPLFQPGIVMEGGSVDFNGEGTLLTTKACLLNPNRNPRFTQMEIEAFLSNYYGVDQILWLGEGIAGDDTDGHVDDLTRFVDSSTVVTMIEHDKSNLNYTALKENRALLDNVTLVNGKNLKVVELPMPSLYQEGDQILPCSYANFYVCNAAVIVPTFQDPNDQIALDILSECFKGKRVTGLDSRTLIWGLGSFHCLSQQEPK